MTRSSPIKVRCRLPAQITLDDVISYNFPFLYPDRHSYIYIRYTYTRYLASFSTLGRIAFPIRNGQKLVNDGNNRVEKQRACNLAR